MQLLNLNSEDSPTGEEEMFLPLEASESRCKAIVAGIVINAGVLAVLVLVGLFTTTELPPTQWRYPVTQLILPTTPLTGSHGPSARGRGEGLSGSATIRKKFVPPPLLSTKTDDPPADPGIHIATALPATAPKSIGDALLPAPPLLEEAHRVSIPIPTYSDGDGRRIGGRGDLLTSVQTPEGGGAKGQGGSERQHLTGFDQPASRGERVGLDQTGGRGGSDTRIFPKVISTPQLSPSSTDDTELTLRAPHGGGGQSGPPPLPPTHHVVFQYFPSPDYPYELRKAGVSGTGRVEVLFGANGHITIGRWREPLNTGLTTAVEKAIHNIRFVPAARDNIAIDEMRVIKATFTLATETTMATTID